MLKHERLQKLRRSLGLSQEAMSSRIGIRQSNYSGIENNKRPLGKRISKDIMEKFDLNPEWWENGIGEEMYVSNKVEEPQGRYRSAEKGVPFYDVDLLAFNTDPSYLSTTIPTGYLHLPGILDCDFSCRISGSSMSPKIYPGAIIVCKQVKDAQFIAFGEIYLVVTAEQRLVRYIRRHPSNPDLIILRSHHPDYDDIEILDTRINQIFLVKMIINQEQI